MKLEGFEIGQEISIRVEINKLYLDLVDKYNEEYATKMGQPKIDIKQVTTMTEFDCKVKYMMPSSMGKFSEINSPNHIIMELGQFLQNLEYYLPIEELSGNYYFR